MAEPRNTAGAKNVQAALRKSIEINLAREKALSDLRIPGGGSSWHSNGIIFSKSGNGTPFSNGLIFSKTGAVELEDFTTLDGQDLIEGLTALDEATFTQFTNRLMAIKQTKAATNRVIGH